MIDKEFILYSREGEKLRCDLRYVQDGKKKPVILFLHGFKGFKDWGPFPTVRHRLAENGFISIGFNFSHNGIGEDLMNFTELERFAENTISRELEETSDVINEIIRSEHIPVDPSEIRSDSIGILGHSLGGGIAIVEGSHHRSIRAIAGWASVSKFNRYTERQLQEFKDQGYTEITNSRTGQVMRLNASLVEDMQRHPQRHDILASAMRSTSQEKGLLLLAGSEDLSVDPQESRRIYDSAVKQFSVLEIIPHTGHTFGAEHPNRDLPRAMERALEITVDFFRKYLVTHPIPVPE